MPHPNSYHGHSEYQALNNAFWQDIWEQDKLLFHLEQPNPFLSRNEEHLIADRENIRVFFPLCGKAVDMKRMYDLGHQIVGVDVSVKAMQQFFEENQLEYSTNQLAMKGTIYKSIDGRIRLYCMDLYEFTNSSLEKNIGGIWDCGAMEAINFEDRDKYVKAVLSVTSKDVRYLITVSEYDSNEYTGPPHSMFEEDLIKLFGDSCAIHRLERTDISDTSNTRDWGMSKRVRCVYLITKK